jgi:hypothetical protein
LRVRHRMRRILTGSKPSSATMRRHSPMDESRRVQGMLIDFGSLGLPKDVRSALADAFWNHVGARPSQKFVRADWHLLRVFARFVAETRSVQGLVDLDRTLLVRYVEWLGQQRGATGTPWSKMTQSMKYNILRRLLQWLERCRPGLLKQIDYPYSPFAHRRCDRQHRVRLSLQNLRAILKACEKDIRDYRALRLAAAADRVSARGSDVSPFDSRGALLEYIDSTHAGIVPPTRVLLTAGYWRLNHDLAHHGGARHIASYLYPTSDEIMPYYIAILIHTAGNPEAILSLRTDCLRSIPLLDDRKVLVWDKPRANEQQRRAFRLDATFDPPALVRDLLEWTIRLRRHASGPMREQLFLYSGRRCPTALRRDNLMLFRDRFMRRHQLPHFELASIRSSVLTMFYRASGDLRQVKTIANHARLSTTVAYVESPEVEEQNRIRLAALQSVFIEHLRDLPPHVPASDPAAPGPFRGDTKSTGAEPKAEAVSMFGFSCKDPLAGIAPGTRMGELCTNFLACLTCPNAIITHDPRTLSRLLQARDHIRGASSDMHPARWSAIYAPQLRILEEDVLGRFSAAEIAAAQRLRTALPALPPLR